MNSRELSKRWAGVLVVVYRILYDEPTEGRRRLYDAVNEAFADAALGRVA